MDTTLFKGIVIGILICLLAAGTVFLVKTVKKRRAYRAVNGRTNLLSRFMKFFKDEEAYYGESPVSNEAVFPGVAGTPVSSVRPGGAPTPVVSAGPKADAQADPEDEGDTEITARSYFAQYSNSLRRYIYNIEIPGVSNDLFLSPPPKTNETDPTCLYLLRERPEYVKPGMITSDSLPRNIYKISPYRGQIKLSIENVKEDNGSLIAADGQTIPLLTVVKPDRTQYKCREVVLESGDKIFLDGIWVAYAEYDLDVPEFQ